MKTIKKFSLSRVSMALVIIMSTIIGISTMMSSASAQSISASFNPQTQFQTGSTLTIRSVYGIATVMPSRNRTNISTPTSSVSSTQSSNSSATVRRRSIRFYPYYPYWWNPSYGVFVGRMTYSQNIVMAGPPAFTIARIAVAPTTPQNIQHVYYNGTVMQIGFIGSAPVVLSFEASLKPAVIYSDRAQLVEVASAAGLTPSSNAWVYSPSSQRVTIYADPSTITMIFYPSLEATQPYLSSIANMNSIAASPSPSNSTPPGRQAPPSVTGTPYAFMGIGLLIAVALSIVVMVSRRALNRHTSSEYRSNNPSRLPDNHEHDCTLGI